MTTVNKDPEERIFVLGKKGRTMELEVPLTPEHLHALERQISDVSAETFSIEAEKKLAVQPLNERLKEAKAREKELLERRQKGVMVVPVPVETRANTFRREKWVVRLDTQEELPDTRVALTDGDLQVLLPGVVLEGDNRPDAPVLNLFAPRSEPAPQAKPWQHRLASPYQDWSLSEVAGKDGGRLYMVSTGPDENPSRAWGPFGFDDANGFLHTAGNHSEALPDDVLSGMAEVLGLEADGEQPSFKGREFEKFMGAIEEALDARTAELQAQSLPPVPEGGLKLYEAGGHPGWAGYVHEGQLFLRPPNVDRFEPPRSPKDKGPLEWDAGDERFDGVKGANVTSDWLIGHDKLLAEFDFLMKSGKITEPVNELLLAAHTDAASEKAQPEEDGAGSETDDDDVALHEEVKLSPGEAAASSAGDAPPDVAKLASKLTDNGRKLLKALVTSGPNTSARLGAMTGCGKPGSALKHLLKDGLVCIMPPGPTELWDITDLGRQVHEQAAQ